MLLPEAVEALSALAHGHRLEVLRLLARAGGGLPAGEIAREVGVLPNTLSTHLTILGHAGLIRSRRQGRSVIYSANGDGVRGLLDFLADACGAEMLSGPMDSSDDSDSGEDKAYPERDTGKRVPSLVSDTSAVSGVLPPMPPARPIRRITIGQIVSTLTLAGCFVWLFRRRGR